VCLDDFEQGRDIRVQSGRNEHEGGQRWDDVTVLDRRDERAGERAPSLRLAEAPGDPAPPHFGSD
jgi:hypothetical protein